MTLPFEEQVDSGILESSFRRMQELQFFTERLTSTGSWSWDILRKTLTWTPEVYRIHDLEYTGNELPGDDLIRKSLNCYQDEDRHEIEKAFQECCEKGIPYDLECRFVSMKGRALWIRTIGRPIYDHDRIVSVAGHIQDITEAKLQQSALTESEHKFRTLVDQAAEMLFLHDKSGNLLDVNARAIMQTGYSRDELLGMKVFDLDPEASSRKDPVVWDQILKKAPVTLEVRHQRKDGSTYDAEVTLGPVSLKGEIHILALARDVSDRIMAERALRVSETNARAIMEASSEVLILIDRNGTVLDTNEAHASRFGLKRSEMIGKHLSAFLSEAFTKQRMGYIRQVIESDLPFSGEEERGGKWTRFSIYPVRDLDGTIDRVAVYADDITDVKNRELEIQAVNRQLVELNIQKDRLHAILAHDMKSPFNSLLGFVRMLNEELPELSGEQLRNLSAQLLKSSTNLYQLLEDMLQWSQIKLGTFPLKMELLSLTAMLEDSMRQVEEVSNLKKIRIEPEVEGPCLVLADALSLKSVFRNILTNAIKFSHPGGSIRITAEPAGEMVEVGIHDQGVGMSEDFMDKLFRIDHKTSLKGTAGESGHGLGLMICKDLLESLGGTIRVASKPGAGSSFYITLPCAR